MWASTGVGADKSVHCRVLTLFQAISDDKQIIYLIIILTKGFTYLFTLLHTNYLRQSVVNLSLAAHLTFEFFHNCDFNLSDLG